MGMLYTRPLPFGFKARSHKVSFTLYAKEQISTAFYWSSPLELVPIERLGSWKISSHLHAGSVATLNNGEPQQIVLHRKGQRRYLALPTRPDN